MKTRLLDLGRSGRVVSYHPHEGKVQIRPVDQQDIEDIASYQERGESLTMVGTPVGAIEAVKYELCPPTNDLPGETRATIKLKPPPRRKTFLHRLFG